MRIKQVEIIGHPGIGDVVVSFMDPAGSIYPLIVLAGGNGVGKTAILDAIQKTFESDGNAQIGRVDLTLEIEPTDLARFAGPTQGAISPTSPVVSASLILDKSVPGPWPHTYLNLLTPSGPARFAINAQQPPWKGVFKSFLSEAALNFRIQTLKSVTMLTLDTPNATSQRSGPGLAQQIGQLLVDIRAADAEELSAWVEKNPGLAPPPSVTNVRFGRFEKAFNAMFPHKRFQKIERSGDGISVEFVEFGRTSTLNTLSTGEKQIVFRAGFLLQNLPAVKEGIILVDEPELSLHPEWQARIVDFYVALLSDTHGRHPQIIFSTHSPFIVHGAAGAKPIILEKDPSTGKITEMAAPYYPSSSGSEAIRAFNIETFLKTAEQPLLILTEGETDGEILNTAWDKLRPGKPRFFETRAALGDRNISITLNDQELFNRLGPTRMIVGLFDFDGAFNQWNGVWRKSASKLVSEPESDCLIKRHTQGLGWAMLLPVPSYRANYASRSFQGNSALSIEFLFEDKDIPDGMLNFKQIPLGTQIPYFKDDQKTAFATHVKSLPAESFSAFEPLLARLEDIHSGSL